MRYILICGLCGVALAIGWLLAGRRIVALLDRVSLAVVERRAVERALYEGGTLEIEGRRLDLSNSAYARVAAMSLDARGRAELESDGRRFAMGLGHPVSNAPGGGPKFEFTKDSGDEIVFTVEQSRVAWPTPFEMNFMTGYAPSRKRNVYLRLRWTKLGGAKLEMLWKAEQGYYSRDGWVPLRVEVVTGGLVRVDIRDASE